MSQEMKTINDDLKFGVVLNLNEIRMIREETDRFIVDLQKKRLEIIRRTLCLDNYYKEMKQAKLIVAYLDKALRVLDQHHNFTLPRKYNHFINVEFNLTELRKIIELIEERYWFIKDKSKNPSVKVWTTTKPYFKFWSEEERNQHQEEAHQLFTKLHSHKLDIYKKIGYNN